MKRKVIQIANSTQLISLPRKWSLKFGIKKGDELEVEEEGFRLLISTEKAPNTREISVDVSGLTPRLADRFMARAYQKGYDSITIKYDNPDLSIAVQEKVKELLGFEVMERTKNMLVIKSISSKLEIDFDASLRKAFLIVLDMADSCVESFMENDNKTLENIYHKDFDVNKFCYFCLRHINKGFRGEFGTHILYYLVESLEDVGDEYKALASHLAKIKNKRKEFTSLLKKVNELTKLAYDFFYKPQKEKAVESIKLKNEITEDIKKLWITKDIHEVLALNSLDVITRIIYHYPTMRLDTLEGLSNQPFRI